MTISIVCNLDSRTGIDDQTSDFQSHNNGVRSWDFMVEGLQNKLNFFRGHETELIAFIDEHERVPLEVLERIREKSDSVVIRRHNRQYRDCREVGYFNDLNYLRALFMARGDTIVHFDADTAAFSRDPSCVDRLLGNLEEYRFVSYPSKWSPRAVDDPTFNGRTWASTRFFACRRDSLQFDVLERSLRDPEWAYATFGTPARKLPWLEHLLSLTNLESVLYPPRSDDDLLVFCWSRYIRGVLGRLNDMTFDEVRSYVLGTCGGINYPNDCQANPI